MSGERWGEAGGEDEGEAEAEGKGEELELANPNPNPIPNPNAPLGPAEHAVRPARYYVGHEGRGEEAERGVGQHRERLDRQHDALQGQGQGQGRGQW